MNQTSVENLVKSKLKSGQKETKNQSKIHQNLEPRNGHKMIEISHLN